jgi:serine/threonine protein kinase
VNCIRKAVGTLRYGRTGITTRRPRLMDEASTITDAPGPALPREGSVVSGYTLGTLLGRGAQGAVYRARRVDDDHLYAAKVVDIASLAPAGLSRLRRECILTSRMVHPGIVTVHQVVEGRNCLVIIMDQALGRPADGMCDGTLGWEMSLRIVVGAARALDYAYRRNGLIHRDIKPANLIVDFDGASLRGVKVVDFGLGRDRSDGGNLTMTGEIMGTPLYMSPEQAQGERNLTFATDLYSLGATLFHLIAGRPVFIRRSPFEVIADHLKSPPPSLSTCAPGCPIPLAELVRHCLAKAPAERFRSYRTFLAMADPILGGNPFDAVDSSTGTTQTGGTTRAAWKRPEIGSGGREESGTTSRVAWRRPDPDATPPPRDRPPGEGGGRQSTRWMFPSLKSPGAPATPPPAVSRSSESSTETTDRLPQEAELTVGPAPDTRAAKPSLEAGTEIDEHFIVRRPLGAGAMGEVYEVEDRFIGRRLAMKIMSEADMRRPAAIARFKCEAAALASVGHPAFPYLAGGGTFRKRDYLYMELAQGMDLRSWLQRCGGHVAERMALAISLQLVQAMEAAYRLSGMVHRDLKPANIMVAEHHDGSPQIRIIDFGVSVYIDYGEWDDYSSRQYTYVDDGNEGRVVGTPAYMSPEQVQAGPPSPLMDMYAIGSILHQLLTGRTPFSAPGVPMLLVKILNEPPPDLEDVPSLTPATRQLVRRMLAKKPEARFKNYRQLAAAISAAMHAARGAGG